MNTEQLAPAPPIPLNLVRWRQDGKPQPGKDARWVAYIDARHAAAALDDWVGPLNWKVEYSPPEVWKDDRVMWCHLSILGSQGEWITKSDIGTESNFESDKGLVSDAFKRAAVAWGIARNIYELPQMWAKNEAEIERKLETGGYDSGPDRDPILVSETQWQQLKDLGAKAKEMFGHEWDRTRETLLDGRTVSWDTTTTGEAAVLIADFKDLTEGEPFGDVGPVSGVQTVLEPPTPVDRGEPLTDPEGPTESNKTYAARVEMMKKPELLVEAGARGLDTAGTAQELRAKIIADTA